MSFFLKILKNSKIFFIQRKEAFLLAWSFFYIRIYLIFLILMNISLWASAYNIFQRVSQDLIVLHYSVDFGVNLIGDVKRLFIIPLLGLLIIIFNFFIILFFNSSKHFKFISHLLLAPILLIHLFLLAALGSIYLVNF